MLHFCAIIWHNEVVNMLSLLNELCMTDLWEVNGAFFESVVWVIEGEGK